MKYSCLMKYSGIMKCSSIMNCKLEYIGIAFALIIGLCVAALAFSANYREGAEPTINGNISVGKLLNMDYAVQNYKDKYIDGNALIKNLSQLNINNYTLSNLINNRDYANIISADVNTINKLSIKSTFDDTIPVYV